MYGACVESPLIRFKGKYEKYPPNFLNYEKYLLVCFNMRNTHHHPIFIVQSQTALTSHHTYPRVLSDASEPLTTQLTIEFSYIRYLLATIISLCAQLLKGSSNAHAVRV